jgi:hypothetical protein
MARLNSSSAIMRKYQILDSISDLQTDFRAVLASCLQEATRPVSFCPVVKQ